MKTSASAQCYLCGDCRKLKRGSEAHETLTSISRFAGEFSYHPLTIGPRESVFLFCLYDKTNYTIRNIINGA